MTLGDFIALGTMLVVLVVLVWGHVRAEGWRWPE